MQYISKALGNGCSHKLKSLNLSVHEKQNPGILPYGLKALGKALSQGGCDELVELNLDGHRLGKEGMNILKEILIMKCCPNLEKISIAAPPLDLLSAYDTLKEQACPSLKEVTYSSILYILILIILLS